MAQSVRMDGDEWADVPENPIWSCMVCADIYVGRSRTGRICLGGSRVARACRSGGGNAAEAEGHVSDVQMNGFSLLFQVPCEKFYFAKNVEVNCHFRWSMICLFVGVAGVVLRAHYTVCEVRQRHVPSLG